MRVARRIIIIFMHPRIAVCILMLVFVFFGLLAKATPAQASVSQIPGFAGSPSDLINAVNLFRTSYGLEPFRVSTILMAAAQGHADYMAATGIVSHTGAGGSTASERLLALDYPLAGDLSLGGFRSENITSGNETMTAQAAVERWTRDALHLDTMISPNLTEIGAGVSTNNGRVYYVIDTARPTDSGTPQNDAPVGGGPTNPPGVSGMIIPVVVVTPNSDGDVIHEVKAGQSLWQIAISYGTRIDEIKRLNNLSGDEIYPGRSLLIKKGVFLTATFPVEASTIDVTASPAVLSTFTATGRVPTETIASPGTQLPAVPENTAEIALGILVLAILGGGIFAWWGVSKK